MESPGPGGGPFVLLGPALDQLQPGHPQPAQTVAIELGQAQVPLAGEHGGDHRLQHESLHLLPGPADRDVVEDRLGQRAVQVAGRVQDRHGLSAPDVLERVETPGPQTRIEFGGSEAHIVAPDHGASLLPPKQERLDRTGVGSGRKPRRQAARPCVSPPPPPSRARSQADRPAGGRRATHTAR